mgnify:FL=1|jgi:dienelactone hydrolase
MKKTLLLPFVLLAVSLPACGGDHSPATTPVYAPSVGELPVPNDFLFAGSTDGTLNLPVADAADFSDLSVHLNAIDGWSTVAPFRFDFTGDVDSDSAVAGHTVRVFEVATHGLGGPITGVVAELNAANFAVTTSDATVTIAPTTPFEPSTSYMVVLARGLKDTRNREIEPSVEFRVMETMEAEDGSAQALVQAMTAAAGTQGLEWTDVLCATTFTTQSIGGTLETVYAMTDGREALVIQGMSDSGYFDMTSGTDTLVSTPTSLEFGPANALFYGNESPNRDANMWAGTMSLPYYHAAGTHALDLGPLTGFWQARYSFWGDDNVNLTGMNTMPLATGTEMIPVLVGLPLVPRPANGWPVVIFQHGITRNRTDLYAVVDALAQDGLASIAIDMPLHGLDEADPYFADLWAGNDALAVHERTFGLDLQNNATGAFGFDGIVDESGAWMMNLASPLTSRDNLRQAVADLMSLHFAMKTMDVTGDGPEFDMTQVSFLGHSLGAIVGTTFLRYASDVQAASLAVPGGGLAHMLNGSVAFGPVIAASLASQGITPDMPEYEDFLWVVQSVTDAGDPVNHAGRGLGATIPIHLMEVVGNGVDHYPDLVVPNGVAGAPLAGTEPLVETMGLSSLTSPGILLPGAGIRAVVRFTGGHHGSILTGTTDAFGDPGVPGDHNEAAWFEMQTQVATFLATAGTMLPVDASSGVVD